MKVVVTLLSVALFLIVFGVASSSDNSNSVRQFDLFNGVKKTQIRANADVRVAELEAKAIETKALLDNTAKVEVHSMWAKALPFMVLSLVLGSLAFIVLLYQGRIREQYAKNDGMKYIGSTTHKNPQIEASSTEIVLPIRNKLRKWVDSI